MNLVFIPTCSSWKELPTRSKCPILYIRLRKLFRQNDANQVLLQPVEIARFE